MRNLIRLSATGAARIGTAVVAGAMLVGMMAAPAQAAPAAERPAAVTSSASLLLDEAEPAGPTAEDLRIMAELKAKADPFMSVTAGNTVVFDKAGAVAAGLDPKLAEDVQRGVDFGNSQAASALLACKNKYKKHRFYHEIALCSDAVNGIIAILGAAGAATALAAYLVTRGLFTSPAAVPLSIISGMLAVGAAAPAFCNRSGTGSRVYIARYGGPPYCTQR